jgi:flagellar hook assembly protein FlgD
VISAVDDQNQTSTIERRFTLDDTLGFAKPVSPTLAVPRATPRAVATFQLTRAATLNATIETQSGVVLRTLDQTQAEEPGVVQVAWDGRTDDGAAVYSGRYVARLTASTEIGSVSLAAPFNVRRLPGRR